MKNYSEYFKEAHRYLQNGKETMRKSPIQYGRYEDAKFVREGAGIAYLSPFRAIDGYLVYRGKNESELPQSIEEYRDVVKKYIPLNGKLMAALNTAYETLHLAAYYRGTCDVVAIKSALAGCSKVIEMLEFLISKPGATPMVVRESSAIYKRIKRKK